MSFTKLDQSNNIKSGDGKTYFEIISLLGMKCSVFCAKSKHVYEDKTVVLGTKLEVIRVIAKVSWNH